MSLTSCEVEKRISFLLQKMFLINYDNQNNEKINKKGDIRINYGASIANLNLLLCL